MYYTSTQLSVRNLCKTPHFAQFLHQTQIFFPRNTQFIPACPVGPADRTGVVNPPKFGGGSPSPGLGDFQLDPPEFFGRGKLEPFETGSLENIFFPYLTLK
jgi:hypothetical protein